MDEPFWEIGTLSPSPEELQQPIQSQPEVKLPQEYFVKSGSSIGEVVVGSLFIGAFLAGFMLFTSLGSYAALSLFQEGNSDWFVWAFVTMILLPLDCICLYALFYLYSDHEFHINVQSNAIEYRAKLKLFKLQWRKKVRKITDAKYLSKVTNTTDGGLKNSFYYLHGRNASGKEWKYYLNHFMTNDDEEKEQIAEIVAERLCVSYHGG